MTPNLSVPRPPARPGEAPDFSDLRIPAAGTHALPDPCVPAHECQELATGLIRVLNDDYQAVGQWDPRLHEEVLLKGLRDMMLTRLYDERLFKMQRQGKISVYFGSLGEEAISAAQSVALEARDMLFPAYRQHGILISRGVSLVEMMCQCLSNSKDRLQGRQLPVFYCFKEAQFFTVSGNLGTQFPQAVGWAMATQYKGTRDIAASWIGEGTTASADFHYALTFASVFKSPVLLNVVNNQWAISTHCNIAAGAQPSFAARALGYGIVGLRVDGNDFLAVYAATRWASERARSGHGATLIELYTNRIGSHSTSDDPARYRARGDSEHWPLGDPIMRLKMHLVRLGVWSYERHADLEKQLMEQVLQCWQQAVSYGTLGEGPRPEASTIFEDVYREMPEHLRQQQGELMRLPP